ncbi:MAG: hypothetical protein E7077_07140 [Bacteroidales bacterium]|nr:hypothetical protein [Bacteroidales bacterium]
MKGEIFFSNQHHFFTIFFGQIKNHPYLRIVSSDRAS